jgi:hypothetical protein
MHNVGIGEAREASKFFLNQNISVRSSVVSTVELVSVIVVHTCKQCSYYSVVKLTPISWSPDVPGFPLVCVFFFFFFFCHLCTCVAFKIVTGVETAVF